MTGPSEKSSKPSQNGNADPAAGKDPTSGKFVRGNRLGRGNAVPRRAATFRAELYRCVTRDDFRAVVGVLVEQAKKGRAWAVKEFMERILGKPIEPDVLLKLEQVEHLLAEYDGGGDG